MFRTSNFDKLLDKATSNLRLEPDWPAILQICDLIRQNDCTPKQAVAGIKKKLLSTNPHQVMFALLVLESIVKNCGSSVHDEITSMQNIEAYRTLVKNSIHENVRTKMLELMQAWAYAFRNTSKYRSIQDAVNILKAEGHKFPALKESDAMFSADSAPEWSDGDVCHRCRSSFTIIARKHHCRACGQVFCSQCSAKSTTLPKFGIEKEVRVCDSCYDQVNKPLALTAPAKSESVELPSSYVNSTLSQENQTPPRKTAEELREEEELNIAIALSQSEAEQIDKDRRVPSLSHPSSAPAQHHQLQSHGSPPSSAPPELSRYLDRPLWEQKGQSTEPPPSAPTSSPGPNPISGQIITDMLANKTAMMKLENGASSDPQLEEFVSGLKGQVEIFVNRMKSNSSRGRSIANDSSVQTLFINITAMHSRLLRFIQQQDDSRVHYEGLQDKLAQVKDSRAALDVLREEHAERIRRAAEQAEIQRQMQMANKLDLMRKKKQEYLQYQRQLALQRVQEQEREMQMRQEQQKHQYMTGGPGSFYLQGSPVHQFHGNPQQPSFNQGYPMMSHPQMVADNPGIPRQGGNQGPQSTQQLQQGQHLPHHLLNMQISAMSQPQQLGNSQLNQAPPGMVPQGALVRSGVGIGQYPHVNQHPSQTPGQPTQLPHQSQLNKQQQPQASQIGIHDSQNHPSQHIGTSVAQQMGPQAMQQPQSMGHQGPQINQQLGQIPQHGPFPHPGPPMGPPGSQPTTQIGPQPQNVPQQMHPKNMHMIFMGQHMNQMPQMVPGQQAQHIGQPQMNGQMTSVNQNMPPGHQVQPMGNHPNQGLPTGQVPQQIPQLGQMVGQNQIPSNNLPPSNAEPKIPISNQLNNMSPTARAANVQVVAPAVSQPPQPAIAAVESSTAELISFD